MPQAKIARRGQQRNQPGNGWLPRVIGRKQIAFQPAGYSPIIKSRSPARHSISGRNCDRRLTTFPETMKTPSPV